MTYLRVAGLCAAVILVATSALTAAGKPSASYTTQQADAGRLDYYASCAECHGANLEGVFGPALAGTDDNLKYQSVAGVYGYMSSHMPHGNPEGLPREQYIDIMAFLMQSHGLASGSKQLTLGTIDAETTLMGEQR